jgi:Flp pilus assembly protein TadG
MILPLPPERLCTLNSEGRILFLSQIHRFRRDNTGNISTIFAVSLVPLLAAVGASVDYSLANME